eukprot:353607-Chlamydomonas_euryale.AAC.2
MGERVWGPPRHTHVQGLQSFQNRRRLWSHTPGRPCPYKCALPIGKARWGQIIRRLMHMFAQDLLNHP